MNRGRALLALPGLLRQGSGWWGWWGWGGGWWGGGGGWGWRGGGGREGLAPNRRPRRNPGRVAGCRQHASIIQQVYTRRRCTSPVLNLTQTPSSGTTPLIGRHSLAAPPAHPALQAHIPHTALPCGPPAHLQAAVQCPLCAVQQRAPLLELPLNGQGVVLEPCRQPCQLLCEVLLR